MIKLLGLITLLLPLSMHAQQYSNTELRGLYSKSQVNWPAIQTSDERIVEPLSLLPIATPRAEHVALGNKLFHDTQLSRDKTVSCASCHERDKGFHDGRATAIGINDQVGTRNTPAIFGIDQWQSFFWDGRAKTAEQQALMPISNPIEMDLDPQKALMRVNKDKSYTAFNKSAFNSNTLSMAQMAEALVAFERTLIAPNTRFKSFINEVQSNPKKAVRHLSDSELNGLHLFRTKAKCMTCHNGALLSDNQFHGTGLHYYGRHFEDKGRFNITNNPSDIGLFRTPSLLGLTQTFPWMHNGLFDDLLGIVNMYNHGGARPKPRKTQLNDPHFPKTTKLLKPLKLTKQERLDLVAFLRIL
ncbi:MULTISPECIES: cytochrome-c peroxidase [unclassified Pseudoalteromonas]|uniref:cytochrome-c peroxidase n=1 Tax=unclassified Pseudoalteromonas TaxID=194690 RepID=UPI00140B5BF9|nr:MULTISPECIES: cytochrome c peroxidase [unclassified Pseudoalteromonas]MBH0043943.1 cytochrome-c peroxidase [Pseudoalteromonas sp. SWXJZ10B]